MLTAPGIDLRLPISNKTRAFGVTPMEHGLRVEGTVEIAGLQAPPNLERAKVLLEHVKGMFPEVDTREHRFWMGFRPSTPDSLPILGLRPISSTNNFNPLVRFDNRTQASNDSDAVVMSRTMESHWWTAIQDGSSEQRVREVQANATGA